MEDMRLSIFILGTTAVGKTKLSLQLCKYLKGQIISCDSKQLYKHADLMTAKSTPQELKMCKHNMVDCLELQEASYNRNKFYSEVKKHTRRIWQQGKTPIFIGGTNYYIEPILYNVQNLGKLKSEQSQPNQTNSSQQNSSPKPQLNLVQKQQIIQQIKSLSKQQKYQRLKQVDPTMAEKLHKNDQTRVTSFLERYYKYNQKPSQNYKPYTNELNNQNTVLFWVRNTDRVEHRIIVEKRIKQMLGKEGILQILSVFMYLDIFYSKESKQQSQQIKQINKQEIKLQLRKKLTNAGIGQSIGYKQFFQFYYCFKQQLLDSNTQQQSHKQIFNFFQHKITNYQKIYQTLNSHYQTVQKQLLNFKILQQAQQELVRDTWAYCKRQITWIRNRIFLKDQILSKRFYILDLAKRQRKYSHNNQQDMENLNQQKQTYDKNDMMQRFQEKVKQRAIDIIDEIKSNGFESCYEKYQVHQQEFKQSKQEIKLQDWKKYQCNQCNMEVNGPHQWKQHIQSKRHIKRVKYLEKKDQIDKWIQFRKKKQEQAKMKQNQVKQNNNTVYQTNETIQKDSNKNINE